MREKGRCYGADPSHVRKSGAPPSAYNCAACTMPPPASYKRKTYFGRAATQSATTITATTITAREAAWRRFTDAEAQQDANAAASALAIMLGLPRENIYVEFS